MSKESRASTIYGRFVALPGQKRVLLGFIGMVLSSVGIYFSDPSRQRAQQIERYNGAPRTST